MSDTLVICSRTADRLCLDVVEPQGAPWRIYFADFDDLDEALRAAYTRGLSARACREAIEVGCTALRSADHSDGRPAAEPVIDGLKLVIACLLAVIAALVVAAEVRP